MLPEFLRTLNKLIHGTDKELESVNLLSKQFIQFDKQLNSAIKRDRNLAFDMLKNVITLLLIEYKRVESQFIKAEKRLHQVNTEYKKSIEEIDYFKAQREWIREHSVGKPIALRSNHLIKISKEISEENLEFFRALLVFADGAKHCLLLERLPNEFNDKLDDPEISPLVKKYFPAWRIEKRFIQRQGASKSHKKTTIKTGLRFENFLTEEGRDLLPYLKSEYSNTKPKFIALMLYVLNEEGLLTQKINADQDVWIASLNASFHIGKKPLTRQAIYKNLNEWREPAGRTKGLITMHREKLKMALKKQKLQD